MNNFDENILNIIDQLSYKFFIVTRDMNVKCTCLSHGSTQADPACKKCLGTGYKIRIKEVEGASQESGVPQTIRGAGGFIIAKNFYIKSGTKLGLDDLIVDGDEAWSVYQLNNKTSFKGGNVYNKFSTVPKKTDTKVFMKNFNEIVGR